MYFYKEHKLIPSEYCIIIPTDYQENIINVILPEYNNIKHFINKNEVQKKKNAKVENYLKIGQEYVAEIITDNNISLKYLHEKNKIQHMEKYQYYKRLIKFFQDIKINENIIEKILNLYHDFEYPNHKFSFDNNKFIDAEEKNYLFFILNNKNQISNLLNENQPFEKHLLKKSENFLYQLSLTFEMICIKENPISKINEFTNKISQEVTDKGYEFQFVKTPVFRIILKNKDKNILNKDVEHFQGFIDEHSQHLNLLKTYITDYSLHS